MKRLTIFCLAILAASLLFPLPTHDARFLGVEITYTLHADGSWDREYYHRVRLDTYYAFNRALGETFIVYDPAFQKLEILKAETTMADGRRVAAPENALNEVLPFAAHGFSDFSGLREMVVTHTGLERGAVVELRYRIRTRPGFLPDFSGREPLALNFPADEYRLEIVLPAGTPLRFFVSGCEAAHSETAEGDLRRHAFLIRESRPAAHEPLAAPHSEPFIVFSTARDWPRAFALADPPAPLPAALAGEVEKLKARHPARPDLLAALQAAVAAGVRNCSLGTEAVGWRPRAPERVFAGNYGTRLEKALLLRALLRGAGMAPELLAVAAGPAFAADVPTPLQVEEFWLKVAEGPHALYLDPGAAQNEFFPYGLQGRDAWNIESGTLEKLPLAGAEQSGVEISGAVTLDTTGAAGTLVVAVRGAFNRYGEATADSAGFITGLLRRVFPVEKAAVKKVLQLTRREIRVEAEISGKWLKEAGGALYAADACGLPGLSENLVILEKRESPLALEAPFQFSLRLALEPAKELALEYAAPAVERRNELGHFSRELVADGDGRLRFVESCGIARGVVAPAEYPLLRELLLPHFAPEFWLVFRKAK